jgi:hypothetical protein
VRARTAWSVAAIVLLVVAGCTSSGGSDNAVEKKSGAGWFQARPLILPGQHAAAARPDAFASLHVPTTEDAYNTLGRGQQAELVSALRAVDCAHPPQLSGSDDRVLCDAESDAFLLGPPLFTGNDVTRAKPSPPSASVADWQVSLSLTSDAGATMYHWTSRHHVTVQSGAFNDVQTSSKPPCGPTTTTPCSAFTAYISENVVRTVPVSFAAVGKTVVISGPFDEVFATGLAQRLTT